MKSFSSLKKRTLASGLAWLSVALFVASCEPKPKSARGFRLPEGNAERGKAAFLKLQCNTCHTVQGVALPASPSKSPITLDLGGEVVRVRTYGGLVTSIINPAHVVSEKYRKQLEGKISPMPEFNDTLTVAQLIDLVAFLQPHYKTIQVDYYEPLIQ